MWNADSKNEKGIEIRVNYRTEYNSEAIITKGKYDFARVITVVDNGQCVLTSDLFKDIPKGAIVMVSLNRGNSQFASDKDVDQIYSLYTYSSIQYTAKYK